MRGCRRHLGPSRWLDRGPWQRVRRLVTLGVALACGGGCTEPAVAPSEERALVLVESVPIDVDGFELEAAPATHAVWLDLVRGAQTTIDVASFYVSNREGGRLEAVLAGMEAAARRGVRVRLLVDAAFADKYPAELERLERTIAVRRLDAASVMGGVQHAKYMVVDGRSLYVGSANFDWRALEHIHELGVLVKAEPLAAALGQVFQLDWELAEGETAAPPRAVRWPAVEVNGERVSLWASPRGWLPDPSSWELMRLIGAIRRARMSVAVQLLSYDADYRDGTPWRELHAALLAAAGRGVRVRLALSHWQQRHMDAVQELQRVDGIDVALVEVPPHASGFIPFARVNHAKYMVIDGELSWIGTSNWQGDYFYRSRNVGLVIEGAATAARLEALFEKVFTGAHARRVDPDATYAEPKIGP